MAEEKQWQQHETLKPCVKNCGFFGSPTTMNLCSKCYKDYRSREQRIDEARLAIETSTYQLKLESPVIVGLSASPSGCESAAAKVPQSGRCALCRKRVGLMGFRCRCGVTFCGSHRYPEKHDCGFDYKAAGKDEIAKANPVVKASKLNKI